MKLGAIIEWMDDLSAFRRQVRLADDLGYDLIGVGDTPARAYELYVSLTVAAHESRNAVLAPMVTTPFLRHPAATATAVSTLHELTGGRVMLALGNGGSTRRVVGRSPVGTPKELHDYVTDVRAILGGGSARVDGYDTEPLARVHPMPIYLAADYPRSLRLAGEIADGVVTTVGMSAELVERKVTTVREAAEKAGRDPEKVEIWGFSFVSVRDTPAEANAEIGAALASDVALRLKAPHMRSLIPPHLVPAVEEMERRYDVWDFTVGGKNARLLEELGLVDFAAGLTGVAGDVSGVAAHLRRLESLGVSGVLAALPVLADPDGTLRGLRQAASA
ncbi:5,10-methylenetetrahydromethanopterin reductase [Streptosporangium carneum]|uniref:5,10-methylenetetrahydromethanopterin reductase n=2 Tax=Streptosporangium carneum TaxID=47481 RepID=A0A9W6I4E1_9ACTN|nr:5,10-methylenetetrahydromethanopterin reductase [Streptosporangium carneum]